RRPWRCAVARTGRGGQCATSVVWLCPLAGNSFARAGRPVSVKDPDARGNSFRAVVHRPLLRHALPAVVMLATSGGRMTHAGICPLAVALSGEPIAVRAVRDQLDARGIADETPSCPAVRARIERRGAALVVGIDRPGGPAIEREVTEPGT